MIQKIQLIICILFIAISLHAQKTERIKVPRINSSSYLLTKDSNQINIRIAEKVAIKLGMQKYHESTYSKSYKRNSGFLGIYTATFIAQPINPEINSHLILHQGKVELKANEQVYFYGFTSVLSESKKADRNYSRLLMSAYQQEMNPNYSKNSDNFSVLIEKDKRTYRNRNWINMGYGMNYLAKNNPFLGSKGFAIGALYVLETLHYIPIFGGAFFGKTQEDKIAIPIIGISSLLIWKGFIVPIMGNKHIKMNRSIIKSGYKIPNSFEY